MNYKIKEDDPYANRPKSMGDLMGKFQIGTKKTKHEHEYQETCSDLEPYYGKAIWSLPYREGFTEFKIKEAHKIAQKRGITTIGYLIGIMKKL